MANSVDPDQTAPIGAVQTAPIGAVCSGSTLFACIPKFASITVVFGNYLQQTTSADDIFRCIILTQGNSMLLSNLSTKIYFAVLK